MYTFSGTIALGVRTTAPKGFAVGREDDLNSQQKTGFTGLEVQWMEN